VNDAMGRVNLPDRPGWWWLYIEGRWRPVWVFEECGEMVIERDGKTPIRFVGRVPRISGVRWGESIPAPAEGEVTA
jgi:hypothetical protein